MIASIVDGTHYWSAVVDTLVRAYTSMEVCMVGWSPFVPIGEDDLGSLFPYLTTGRIVIGLIVSCPSNHS
jgi:hypothetical protein